MNGFLVSVAALILSAALAGCDGEPQERKKVGSDSMKAKFGLDAGGDADGGGATGNADGGGATGNADGGGATGDAGEHEPETFWEHRTRLLEGSQDDNDEVLWWGTHNRWINPFGPGIDPSPETIKELSGFQVHANDVKYAGAAMNSEQVEPDALANNNLIPHQIFYICPVGVSTDLMGDQFLLNYSSRPVSIEVTYNVQTDNSTPFTVKKHEFTVQQFKSHCLIGDMGSAQKYYDDLGPVEFIELTPTPIATPPANSYIPMGKFILEITAQRQEMVPRPELGLSQLVTATNVFEFNGTRTADCKTMLESQRSTMSQCENGIKNLEAWEDGRFGCITRDDNYGNCVLASHPKQNDIDPIYNKCASAATNAKDPLVTQHLDWCRASQNRELLDLGMAAFDKQIYLYDLARTWQQNIQFLNQSVIALKAVGSCATDAFFNILGARLKACVKPGTLMKVPAGAAVDVTMSRAGDFVKTLGRFNPDPRADFGDPVFSCGAQIGKMMCSVASSLVGEAVGKATAGKSDVTAAITQRDISKLGFTLERTSVSQIFNKKSLRSVMGAQAAFGSFPDACTTLVKWTKYVMMIVDVVTDPSGCGQIPGNQISPEWKTWLRGILVEYKWWKNTGITNACQLPNTTLTDAQRAKLGEFLFQDGGFDIGF